jgi:hypothetical protein
MRAQKLILPLLVLIFAVTLFAQEKTIDPKSPGQMDKADDTLLNAPIKTVSPKDLQKKPKQNKALKKAPVKKDTQEVDDESAPASQVPNSQEIETD